MQNDWFLQCFGAGDISGDSWYYNKKEDFDSLIQLSPELSPARKRSKIEAFCMVFCKRDGDICRPTIPRMWTACGGWGERRRVDATAFMSRRTTRVLINQKQFHSASPAVVVELGRYLAKPPLQC